MITEVLKTVATPIPLGISVKDIGFFPSIHSARVLWAGVHAPQSLNQLAHDTDQTLHRLKIPVETHAYSPHVTLARIKADLSLAAIRDVLIENKSREFGSFAAKAFHLYLSRPASGGSKYEILATFPFQ
jgi:2'-5' RNA ligase